MTMLFTMVVIAVIAIAAVSMIGGGRTRGEELTRERMARHSARAALGAGTAVRSIGVTAPHAPRTAGAGS